MNVKRATSDVRYKEFCSDESYKRNLSYVCLGDNDELFAVADFIILNHLEARINNIRLLSSSLSINDSVKLFIEEFSYWNPFIKTVTYQNEIISISNNVDIFKVSIMDIEVEQLTVSKTKLDNALSWVNSEQDVIICVILLDGKYVCIDGYSRLMAAYLKGFDYVYCYLERDSYDESNFREFLKWCHEENIYTIKDLVSNIVSEEEHKRLWIDRCQKYLKEKN